MNNNLLFAGMHIKTEEKIYLVRTVIIIIAGIFLSTTPVLAETVIRLKTGESLQGEIVEKSGLYLLVNIDGKNVVYFNEEIDSIVPAETSPSPSKTSQTIIRGTVTFEHYQQGPIIITAFDSLDRTTRRPLATTSIPAPGAYQFLIAENIEGEIFVLCFNDFDDNGILDRKLEWSSYYGTPAPPRGITLDKPVIDAVDLLFIPRAAVSGTVGFQDYIRGGIYIKAYDSPGKSGKLIAITRIPAPGHYMLTMPPGTKEAYIFCFNDANNNTFFDKSEPSAWLGADGTAQRILLNTPVTGSIDIELNK